MSKLLSKHNLIEYREDIKQVKINPKWKFVCEECDEPRRRKTSHRNNHDSSEKKAKKC
jgi:uncharacterized protein YlaI